jgi:hypothetical protein
MREWIIVEQLDKKRTKVVRRGKRPKVKKLQRRIIKGSSVRIMLKMMFPTSPSKCVRSVSQLCPLGQFAAL